MQACAFSARGGSGGREGEKGACTVAAGGTAATCCQITFAYAAESSECVGNCFGGDATQAWALATTSMLIASVSLPSHC